jgi:hypothetical protein
MEPQLHRARVFESVPLSMASAAIEGVDAQSSSSLAPISTTMRFPPALGAGGLAIPGCLAGGTAAASPGPVFYDWPAISGQSSSSRTRHLPIGASLARNALFHSRAAPGIFPQLGDSTAWKNVVPAGKERRTGVSMTALVGQLSTWSPELLTSKRVLSFRGISASRSLETSRLRYEPLSRATRPPWALGHITVSASPTENALDSGRLGLCRRGGRHR